MFVFKIEDDKEPILEKHCKKENLKKRFQAQITRALAS